MQTKPWAACLACLVVGFALSGFTQSSSTGQEKAANPVRVKWEYKKVFDPNEPRLNELGQEGWELLPQPSNNQPPYCYFRRVAP